MPTNFFSIFEPASIDYPNHLASPTPERLSLKTSYWLLLALVLFCMLSRIWLASRITSICPDGIYYIEAARALEDNNLREGFRLMSLNVYPVILMLLHKAGAHFNLSYEFVAAVWGIAISGLTVLPLYGWVRRQFDDRVALWACLFFAIHPKLIAESPEIMRDPTFWFFFMMSIYCLWRAITEVRYLFFIAAGIATLFAILLRTEGFLLFIPLFFWTLWRVLALSTQRRKLIFGMILCVATGPLILAGAYAMWLYGYANWPGVRVEPLLRIRPWLDYLMGKRGITSTPEGAMTFSRMLWIFFPTLCRGLFPVYAIVMLWGLWCRRQIWGRRDHQAMFYVAMCLVLGIWVHIWLSGVTQRYILPVVLMAMPFAVLGFMDLAVRLGRLVAWLHGSPRTQQTVVTIAITLAAATTIFECMKENASYYQSRNFAANIGRWVQKEYTEPHMMTGPWCVVPIVNYHACGQAYSEFYCTHNNKEIIEQIKSTNADVVILEPWKQLTTERCDTIAGELSHLGYKAVHPEIPNKDKSDIQVLVREQWAEMVQKTPTRR
jgi:hypothetical protein